MKQTEQTGEVFRMGLAARDKLDQQNTGGRACKSQAAAPSESLTTHSSLSLADIEEEYYLLAGIAANMRSGFLLLNQAERITYANPSAQRLLGIADELLDTRPAFDVRQQLVELAVNPASARAELDRLWRHPEEESSTDLALTSAAVRWLRVRSFPVRDNPGHLLGRGVLLDDITLERSADSTRGETLAMAAHELKTPLAIIKGSATTLLSNSMRWDPAMQREMLQMIDTQADRLHEILNTLLEVWRLDAGAQNLRFSQVRVSELLHGLKERWRRNAPRHHISCEITGEIPPVLCDPTRLEQALQQLFHNAVTYSPHGGRIHLTLESDENELRLSISDQGRGIAPEHLDHIFDRFYRVSEGDEQAQGSGLGLAVARATIEAHGGRIWADSPGPGAGTTIYCTLPFTPPGAQALPSPWQASGRLPALKTSTTPARYGQRVRVAVVESDARTARYLRAHLEEQHYRVQVLNHGTRFLHQFDLEEPELVLLATRLADMQGIELLQRLREFSNVPVMMLCDNDDEDERAHLLDLGADDLVSKPLGMKELLARLRVLLRRRGEQGEIQASESIFTTGDLVIDYAQHQVLLQGRPVQLSRTEYKLLSTLAQNAGRVMTHELLLERVWGAEYNREVDFIWVYISRLRRKIEADPRHPRYIVTVPDVGYKLAKV
jgi:DNA-binding response OmpR family regulator/signal transduction histidine kinase